MGTDKKLLLEVSDLKVHFHIKSDKAWPWAKPSALKAVDGVTLRLYEGETLGVVGESGCGKSTFARALIGLVPATDGKVVWLGQDLTKLEQNALLQRTLREAGFRVEAGVAGMPTAFVAEYGAGGPVLGILAEFDALPGITQTASPERMLRTDPRARVTAEELLEDEWFRSDA